MTLRVPFPQFLATVVRLVRTNEVYLERRRDQTVATAARPDLVVVSTTDAPVTEVRAVLEPQGIRVFDGAWSFDGEMPGPSSPHAFIAAVAYRTTEGRPGLWVDAFLTLPTELQVLQALHAEMSTDGEVDMSFDAFMKVANANIVVLTPDEIGEYLARKEPPTDSVPAT